MTFLGPPGLNFGLAALCLAGASPELRAAMMASNGMGGLAFMVLAWQLWMLRTAMRRQLPAWFVGCATWFIGLCGVHHALHGLDVLYDVSWADAGVTSLMSVVAWVCVIGTGVALPGWLERRGPRHDPANVAQAHDALVRLVQRAAAGDVGPIELAGIAAQLRPLAHRQRPET